MDADVVTPGRRSEARPAKTGRREDYRFITGVGQYIADTHLAGEAYAAFARSPHAHARLKSIDVSEACLAPLTFASHSYETFHLLMPLYVCRRWEGIVAALERQG